MRVSRSARRLCALLQRGANPSASRTRRPLQRGGSSSPLEAGIAFLPSVLVAAGGGLTHAVASSLTVGAAMLAAAFVLVLVFIVGPGSSLLPHRRRRDV